MEVELSPLKGHDRKLALDNQDSMNPWSPQDRIDRDEEMSIKKGPCAHSLARRQISVRPCQLAGKAKPQ